MTAKIVQNERKTKFIFYLKAQSILPEHSERTNRFFRLLKHKILQVAAGFVDPRQGGVVLRPAPELRRRGVGYFFPWSWLGPAAGRRIVGVDAGPLAQVELVDVGLHKFGCALAMLK